MAIYMASAVGFSFSFHYCGGHYKGICFTSDTEKGCCGKNEHKTNCCEDKVVKAKFKDDHSSSAKAILAKIFSPQAIQQYPALFNHKVIYVAQLTYVANDSSPPFTPSTPLYLMNRVLRI